MTNRDNKQRILRFLRNHSDWATRKQIASGLGWKRMDKWEMELIYTLLEEGLIEQRIIPFHPKSHLPYYQYRVVGLQ